MIEKKARGYKNFLTSQISKISIESKNNTKKLNKFAAENNGSDRWYFQH